MGSFSGFILALVACVQRQPPKFISLSNNGNKTPLLCLSLSTYRSADTQNVPCHRQSPKCPFASPEHEAPPTTPRGILPAQPLTPASNNAYATFSMELPLHGAARAAFCARIVRCVFFLPKFNTFVFLDAGARSGCSFGGEALVLPKYLAKCTRQYVTTLQQSSLLCPHLRSRTFDLHINLHMLMPYLLRFFVAQDPMGIKVVCG
jgi:hypothetical protein